MKGRFSPVLDAPSPPTIGRDSPIRITGALPGAMPLLVLGASAAALPFDGGTLLVAANVLIPIPVPIAANGSLTLHGVLPADPILCGVDLYAQAFYVDVAAAGFCHVALTNGLKRTIGSH